MQTGAAKTTDIGRATAAPACGHERSEGGAPCQSTIGLCSECGHCLNHCDHRKKERRQAKAKGGRTTSAKRGRGRPQDVYLPEEDALPRPKTITDCALWLSTIAWAVSVGRLSPDRADKARAATRDLKDLLLKDQDQRIAELEKTIGKLRRGLKESN